MTLNALARFMPIIVASSMIVGAAAAEELATFTLCKLIPTEWADGDSFLIQTADGTSHPSDSTAPTASNGTSAMKPMPDASGLSGDISEFQRLEGRPRLH